MALRHEGSLEIMAPRGRDDPHGAVEGNEVGTELRGVAAPVDPVPPRSPIEVDRAVVVHEGFRVDHVVRAVEIARDKGPAPVRVLPRPERIGCAAHPDLAPHGKVHEEPSVGNANDRRRPHHGAWIRCRARAGFLRGPVQHMVSPAPEVVGRPAPKSAFPPRVDRCKNVNPPAPLKHRGIGIISGEYRIRHMRGVPAFRPNRAGVGSPRRKGADGKGRGGRQQQRDPDAGSPA